MSLQRVFRYFQLRDADRQGDGKLVQMFGGASSADYTAGDVAVFDASGNVVDSGQLPGSQASGGYGDPWQQVPIGVMTSQNADFYTDFIPLTFVNKAGQQEVWMMLAVNGVDQDPYFHFHCFVGTNHFVMRFPPKASDVEMVVRYFRGIPAYTPPPPGVPSPPPPPPPGGVPGCTGAVATYINGPGPGPHTRWRVNVTANETTHDLAGNAYGISCAELGLHIALGGSSVATGGTALESDNFPGLPAANAFDADPSTIWGAAGPIFGSAPYLGWLGYQLGSPANIIEFSWTSRADGAPAFQVPTVMTLDWSDDGTNWTQGWGFTVPVACWVAVGAGGTLTFSTGGGPPPAPTSTLAIWADYAGTVNGLPALSYTLDGGLTWVGGDGTLPADAGMANPFPSPTFANQKIPVTIPLPPDLTKFRVRLFIAEGASPATAVNDQFDIFDVQLNLDSTGYGSPQGSRTVGPEPGLQFGKVSAGLTLCQFGEYQKTATGSVSGNCPNFIKLIDTLLSNASRPFESFTYFPFAEAERFNVRLNGGQVGYIFTFWQTAPRIALNVADPAYLDYVFNTYLPTVFLPHVASTARPVYIAIDGYSTNYDFIGSINTGSFVTGNWDTGFPQSVAEWTTAWANFYTYAKIHAPNFRLAPHIGSMRDPGWDKFAEIYADCPAMEQEIFPMSAGGPSGAADQNYNTITNLSNFANVMPPVFAGDPATRVLTWGTTLDNGDIHSALGLYAMVRGPNTFFALLDSSENAIDPAQWLPTANKLGETTSAPVAIVGSGATSLLKRTFQGGIAYHNIGAGTQTITLPAGATDWNGSPLSTLTLANGKGDVVLVGTPVSAGVRATRTNVIVGSDGTVTNPSLAIDKDADPPVTAATITRTNFSVSMVGSVLELSGFGG